MNAGWRGFSSRQPALCLLMKREKTGGQWAAELWGQFRWDSPLDAIERICPGGIPFFESGEEPVCIEGGDIGAAAGRDNLWRLSICKHSVIQLYSIFPQAIGISVHNLVCCPQSNEQFSNYY